jgi:hypothetical protein
VQEKLSSTGTSIGAAIALARAHTKTGDTSDISSQPCYKLISAGSISGFFYFGINVFKNL